MPYKITSEAVMTAETPNASNVVCTIHQLINPAVVAIPLLTPFINDCVNTKILSGPGDKAKTNEASENERRFSSILLKLLY